MKRVHVYIQGQYVRTFEGFSFSAIEEAIAIRGYGNRNHDTVYSWE
jgi:hypothetical protein